MGKHPVELTLPPSLLEKSNDRAAKVLAAYFAPVTPAGGGFTGGRFDTFDPSGTRSASVNTFTSDDLAAVSLLSVEVSARAALELLVSQRRRYEVLLEALGPDIDLVEVPSVAKSDFRPAWELWSALSELPGLGPTTVSKLMARKRPRMIPIYDSVINEVALGGSGVLWSPMHAALSRNNRALHQRLLACRAAAGLNEAISVLRVFDVLAWMDGSGKSDRILESQA